MMDTLYTEAKKAQ